MIRNTELQGNVCTRAQRGAIKKAAEVGPPFPTKPVNHKRLPRIQDRPSLQQFEKTTLSSQPRGRLIPPEHQSGGNRETPTYSHSQIFSQKWQSEELQMTRAIQEKELLLKEKLWRVGEKIRQTIQSCSADTAAGYEHNEKERQYIGQEEWEEVCTKGRLSEYQRTPLRRRDMLDDESLLEDLMQLRIKQDQRSEDRKRNKNDLQQARWDPSEHTTNSVKSNLRLEKLNEPFRRKQEVEKDYGTWKETEARYREQNEATVGKATWTKEKKYKERTPRDNDGLDHQQNMSQKRLHSLATEKCTRANQPNDLTLPPLSGPFHHCQQQQAGPSIAHTKGGSLQLLPCEICKQTFQSERLEKHSQICANIRRHEVFNSSAQRMKGTQVEEYFKTNERSKSPEVLKRKERQNHKRNM